ncbi:MAG: hypothetical protein SNG14_07815 [Rikenellaceae bacterium]
MENYIFVLLISVGAVAFFAVGLSITLMIKGHFIDSEISTNKHMRAMGIHCAVQETRIDQDGVSCHDYGCHSNCAACDIDHEAAAEKIAEKAKKAEQAAQA